MVNLYEIKKSGEEYYDRNKWFKTARAFLSTIGIPTDLLLSLKDAREDAFLHETVLFLKSKLNELDINQDKLLENLSDFQHQINELFRGHKQINEFISLIKIRFNFPQIVSSLQTYFSQLPSKDPHKFLIENKLAFLPQSEIKIISKIENLFTNNIGSFVLITGLPESGKSILGYQIGLKFISKDFSVFYIRLDNLPDLNLLWNDLLFLNDSTKVLVIIDNCHASLNDAIFILQNFDKIQNLNCIFLSRPTDKYEKVIGEYEHISFKDYFESTHFTISQNNFDEKVSGIIHNYKDWYEKQNNTRLEIGNERFVINNSQKNLITLYYNLLFWKPNTRLSKLEEKGKIFQKIFNTYLNNVNHEKLILIASLSKYEIYYEAKEEELKELNNLVNDGILRNNQLSPYFYLYHSSFAKLLLNSFTVHSSFKRYSNLEDLCYVKISTYINSFEDYPLNLGALFHNLINNHGETIAVKLLRHQLVFDKVIKYYFKNGHYLKLLFVLYRIGKHHNELAKSIFDKLPAELWANDFRKFSIAGISVGLLKLNSSAPQKASEVLSEFNLPELVEFSRKTKFNLLANSLRELDILSGQKKIGFKIYQNLTVEELLAKIYKSSLSHIGKGLSELYRVDKEKTKAIISKIDAPQLQINFIDYNIKYISKTLNEIYSLDAELSLLLFNSLNTANLVSNIKKLEAEGLGRSLMEFSKINLEKSKEIFLQIDDAVILNTLKRSSLEQISQSLSEMLAVDKDKTKNIFQLLDANSLRNKIHNKQITFQKIGVVLHNFKKYDNNFFKIRSILANVDLKNFIGKADSSDFNNFCINLTNIKGFDKELASSILDGIDKKRLIMKAKSEHLKNIGSALNKLKKFNEKLANEIAQKIDFQKVVEKSKNITFTQLANSLTNLNKFNKILSKNIYNSFDISTLVAKAKASQTSLIKDSLRKLRTVDESRTREIFHKLNINK